jgi:hypothetical protein
MVRDDRVCTQTRESPLTIVTQSRYGKNDRMTPRTAFFFSVASDTPASGRSASSKYSDEVIMRPSRSSRTPKSRTIHKKDGKYSRNSVPDSSSS